MGSTLTHTRLMLLLTVLAGSASIRPCSVTAQQTKTGRVVELRVHAPSLENNIIGLPADRAVSVYLPPSYEDSGTRKYPVVYLLHGIMDSNRTWTVSWGAPNSPDPAYGTIQQLMNHGIARGLLNEMIVVAPDADKTCHYTDSPVKGNWGSFIAKDLVQFVDTTYRTIRGPEGRGLLGHSMGGHGAIKIAMNFPGVFGTVYAMNPSLLGWGGDLSASNPALNELSRVREFRDLEQANFYVQAIVGIGQCFSPSPGTPLLTTLPFGVSGGDSASIYRRWTMQMPVYLAPTHVAELNALRGLRFDSAFEDEFSHIPIAARAFANVLDSLGVTYTFEMYNGDHRNRLWGANGRLYTSALPYFSRLLNDSVGNPRAVTSAAATNVPVAGTSTASPAQLKLWRAAQTGDLNAANAALKDGADVNALDYSLSRTGRRALNYAAENNLDGMIRWLVKNRADVNLANTSGFTPLHHAAEQGAVAATKALLELGANPKATLPSGSTPLIVARQRGKTDVVKVLLTFNKP